MSLKTKTIKEKVAQNNPATATVVKVGVFLLHLKETEKLKNQTMIASQSLGQIKFQFVD